MSEIQKQILKIFFGNKFLYYKYKDISIYNNIYIYNTLLSLIGHYYSLHKDNKNIDIKLFIDFLSLVKVSKEIIDSAILIQDVKINSVEEVLQYVLKRKLYQELSRETSKGIEQEKFDIDKVSELINQLNDVNPSRPQYESLDLFQKLKNRSGFEFRLPSLKRMVGPICGGDVILVFARVETGKTGFIVDSNVGFIEQGARIIHFNNEDPAPRVLERYYINHFKQNKATVFNKLQEHSKIFDETYRNKLFVVDSPALSVFDIDSMVQELKPHIIVIDQVDNLAENTDINILAKLYSQLRQLAKRRNITVLEVTQSAGRVGNYLGLDDVYGSLVVKQAAADVVIGIGVGNVLDPLMRRYFSLPKNKLKGIHGKFEAKYNGELMAYQE